MPLAICETENAGLLREAANAKGDERILTKIRDKDCVAIEVRYHQKCYKNYTNFLYRKEQCSGTESSLLYNAGFERFCKDVIDPLIKEKKIEYMSHLHERFVNIVGQVEGVDASNFRRFRLKARLKKLYPQLVFHTPKIRNRSEMVYPEDLSSGDLVDEHMSSMDFDLDGDDTDSEMEWEEENVDQGNKSSNDPCFNDVQILYNASLLLRTKIKSSPVFNTPWPPRAVDITKENAEKIVSPILFNVLAWICGFSDEPQLDDYVIVKDSQHCKLMAIAQDLLFVASSGQNATPKTISLAMAMRQLTGSSTVLNLLNHFGHCMSHEYVLRHETALAQINISSEGALPPGFSKHEFTTIAWDNDDFCEETKTGKGTTHVTGGIIIQRQSYEAEESERASIPRSSSLKLVPDEIAPYLPGKRVTVDLKEALDGVSIDESDYLTTQKTAKIFDLSLVLCRSLQDEYLFPNWTGFNTLLQSREIPVLSKVGYLPVINAPPTEMSTINAILKKSKEIANRLCIPYACLVFDESIYAKIQEMRWKDTDYLNKFIVRLGEFHMAMSFCGAIGKLFKDAGLRVG